MPGATPLDKKFEEHLEWAARNLTEVRERLLKVEGEQDNKVDAKEFARFTQTVAVMNNTLEQLVKQLSLMPTRDEMSQLSMSIEFLTSATADVPKKEAIDAQIQAINNKANAANATAWKLFGAVVSVISIVDTIVFFWIAFVHR